MMISQAPSVLPKDSQIGVLLEVGRTVGVAERSRSGAVGNGTSGSRSSGRGGSGRGGSGRGGSG